MGDNSRMPCGPDRGGLRKQRGNAGDRISGNSRRVGADGAVGGGSATNSRWLGSGAGDCHRSEYAANGRVRVDPPRAGGPAALRYAYHRSERRYGPDDSASELRRWEWKRFFRSRFRRRWCAANWSNFSMAVRRAVRNSFLCLALCLAPATAGAQTAPDLAKILERLDRLEQENRSLSNRYARCRRNWERPRQPPPTVDERIEIQQQRIEEQAQTKVEASQKFPIRLAGMALFNAFVNSKQSGGADYPVVAAPTGPGHDGATVRQTIIGLEFAGPRSDLGRQGSWVRVHGFLCRRDEFGDAHPYGLHRASHGKPAASPPAWRSRFSIRASRVRWRRWAFPR